MGKTTNALEQVVHSFFENKEQFPQDMEKVREDHHRIIEELFEWKGTINQKVNALFDGVLTFLNTTDIGEYSLVYDQVVSVGELFPPPSSVPIWKGRYGKHLVGCPRVYQNGCLFSRCQFVLDGYRVGHSRGCQWKKHTDLTGFYRERL